MHFAKASLAALLCLSATVTTAAAQTNDRAPVYDSADQAGAPPSYVAGTPESDARPGQYYFNLGAEAFRRQQYRHAIDMYRVAASWAYKPAEYNLGVMYALGQGVPVDLPRAAAWMTLAAERKDPTYVHALGLVRGQLSADQATQADAILQELSPTYADKHALLRAKTRWAQVRASMTGSRVGSMSSPVAVGSNAVSSSGRTSTSNGQMSQAISTSPGELTGSADIDGSIAYRQLTASNNPYDPKFRAQTGTATVGALTPVSAASAHAPPDAAPAAVDDSRHP